MLLLPIADPLGVLGVAEVILVLSFSQPSPHEFPLSGLAALGFEAVARALSAPVIGKKKSLAVQALASASGRLHRFQTQKEPLSENAANRRKKIQPQQNSDRRRRKKSFQQTLRRKLNRRRSHSRPSVLHPFHFNGGTKDACWEGFGRWTAPGALNFGSDSNTRPASGVARFLRRG